MSSFKTMQSWYKNSSRIKDQILSPIVRILAWVKIPASALSVLGIVLMIGFVLTIQKSVTQALILLVATVLLDLLDGALARHTKTASDKGKFIDMICDVTTFTLFIVGITLVEFVPGYLGILVVFSLVTSKLTRSVHNASHFKSDWQFKAVAGFLPNLFVILWYLNFLGYVLWQNWFEVLAIATPTILFIDSIYFIKKIL